MNMNLYKIEICQASFLYVKAAADGANIVVAAKTAEVNQFPFGGYLEIKKEKYQRLLIAQTSFEKSQYLVLKDYMSRSLRLIWIGIVLWENSFI